MLGKPKPHIFLENSSITIQLQLSNEGYYKSNDMKTDIPVCVSCGAELQHKGKTRGSMINLFGLDVFFTGNLSDFLIIVRATKA